MPSDPSSPAEPVEPVVPFLIFWTVKLLVTVEVPASVVYFIGMFTKTLLKSELLPSSCSDKVDTFNFASELSVETANVSRVPELAKVIL